MPVSKTSTDGCELAESGRLAMDRPALDVGRRRLLVDRLPEHVPDAAERAVADGNRDRRARVDDGRTARKPVRRVHGDGANAVVAEVLLHLRDEGRR